MEPWRILVVDDEVEIAEQTARLLRNDPASPEALNRVIDVETSFEKALDLVKSARIDVMVLDVRDQDAAGTEHNDAEPLDSDLDHDGSDVTTADAGLLVFEKIRARRFVPVIFHTALPNLVDPNSVRPPFVQVVSKNDSDSTKKLRDAVRTVLESTVPAIHRALNDHVEAIVRDFMNGFVEKHWGELESPQRRGDLAHLLLRRLAMSLADGGQVLAERLTSTPGVDLTKDHVHPMRFYVTPPVGDYSTGDILRRPSSRVDRHGASEEGGTSNLTSTPLDVIAGQALPAAPDGASEAIDSWFVVLTPACDLVQSRIKADFVVLAQCDLLEQTDEYKAWVDSRPAPGEAPSSAAKKAHAGISSLMRNRRDKRQSDRDYYLPGAWSVPNLLVDFQKVSSVPVASLGAEYERVASLDSPYVEALIETFSRYLGRRGTPDLDVEMTIKRLAPLEVGDLTALTMPEPEVPETN